MLVFIQSVLAFVLLVTSYVSSQNSYQPYITCYMRYEHEETRIRPSNAMVGDQYYKTESTQYQTTDNELCSKVGCTCFSYQSVCGYSTPGSSHVSSCTDVDRQNGIVKWHRGWTSLAKCEEMRQQPQTYHNLTCCQTPRCNAQPGKITKFIDIPAGAQVHEIHGHPSTQALPTSHAQPQQYDSHGYPSRQPVPGVYQPSQRHDSYNQQFQPSGSISHKTPQPYDSYGLQSPQLVFVSHKPPASHDFRRHQSPHSSSVTSPPSPRYNTHVRHPTTSRLPDAYKPSEVYDRSRSSNSALLFSSVSTWMIFLSFVCYLFNTV